MIIDTHTHMADGGWPPGSTRAFTAEQMINAMDRFDVEKIWIFTETGLVRDCIENNTKLHDFVKYAPKRFIPFLTVNANYHEQVPDEIRRCVEDLGFRGIKLHPWLQGFSLTSAIVFRMIEESIKYKIPVIVHDGTPPYCDTLQVANLAEIYPESKIILGHSGLHDTFRSAIIAANRFKNIYLCVSATEIGDNREIIRKVDNDRILFGSDFGVGDSSLIQDRIDALKYACETEEQERKFFYENARRLIGDE